MNRHACRLLAAVVAVAAALLVAFASSMVVLKVGLVLAAAGAAVLLWRLPTLARGKREAAFLMRALDTLPVPISVKNDRLEFVAFNAAFLRAAGSTAQVVLGQRTGQLIGDQAGARAEEMDRAVLAGGQTQIANEWLANPQGGRRFVRITKARSADARGEPVVLTSYEDLTQLREQQDQQSALRGFLQEVIDALPNPLFIKNRQHRYVMTNRAHVHSLGRVSSEDVIGKCSYDFSPDVAADIEEAEDRLFSSDAGGIEEHEYMLTDGQGRRRATLIRKALGTGPNGEPVVIGVNTDVTELREVERDLRGTLHRFAVLLEKAPLGVALFNGKGMFLGANPSLRAMTGYALSELKAMTYRQLAQPNQPALERGKLRELLGKGYCEPFERAYRRKDGSLVHVMVSAVLVTGQEHLQVWGLVQDMTELRAAGEEVRRHRDHLRELVREQTVDLVRAKESAERASESKSTFLANMSHELRTPMHAILSFAHLGEQRAERVPAAKLREYFSRVRNSGERLMGLLNDLLDLSKLDAGSMSIDLADVFLGDPIAEVTHEFDALLVANGLRLVVDIDPALPHVLADRQRIGQVIRNLMSNAIKFSPPGRTVAIRARCVALPEDPAANVVECVVSDEGVGIPEGELDAIFDKFFQSTRTRTGAGGTGLGLAICREIVAAHGGQIFARRRMLRGAEFVMRLPVIHGHDSQDMTNELTEGQP
ncbi:MAG: PAS domain-containing protein [Rhodocyclaceae bacterium]